MDLLLEPVETAAATNEAVQHPEPRHIRLALHTLLAAGTLTPEAEHALRLAGAHYRNCEQYAAWGELHALRDKCAALEMNLSAEKRRFENKIETLNLTIKGLRR